VDPTGVHRAAPTCPGRHHAARHHAARHPGSGRLVPDHGIAALLGDTTGIDDVTDAASHDRHAVRSTRWIAVVLPGGASTP